jgi:nitrate/nitrite transporter NarK
LLKDAPHHGEKTAEIQPVKVKFPNAVLSLFSQRAYCFLLLLWSIMGVIAWMVIGWMPAFYQEHFSLSQAVAGFYATACLYPGSIIGLLLGGYLADRWGKSNPRARVYLPIIGFAIAIPAIFIATNTTLVAITISMFMVYAVTRNFCDANITPLLCLSADGRFTATGFGILNLFACVAGGIGIYGGGLLRDRHVAFSSIFQSVALLLVIGIGLLFLIKGQLFDKKKPV